MAAIRHMSLWRELRQPSSFLLLVTIALCLVRARDQPGIDVSVAGTSAHVVPEDLALVALLVVAVITLRNLPIPGVIRLALVGAIAFCSLVLVTSALNGAASLVAGVKLVELSVLGLGVLTLARDRSKLDAVVDALLVFTVVADGVGIVKFVTGGGGRQSSFLGEHDFAALATLPLLYGLVLTLERRRPRRAILCVVAGSIGCILGAALASLLGLYLGAFILVVVSAVRRRLGIRSTLVVAATLAAVTAGTLTIRAGDLSFLQSWFGKQEQRPGQYAASWSQRLVYAYVGGRVFFDHPVIGTGWYPLLPPAEFDRYLGDARRRFSDQPANYFPPGDKPFIPQQTYDQVLYELGVVGAATFATLLAGLGLAAVRAAGARLLLPAAWLAGSIGALAGEGLFGGTPLAATFWVTAGACLVLAVVPEAAP